MNAAREPADLPPDVVLLLLEHADSVPHLEALQLIWETEARPWTATSICARLYVAEAVARGILRDLHRRGLLDLQDEAYGKPGDPVAREVARKLVHAYQANLSAVARLIHSRAPASVREFARAFRIKEDN
jgi:hypothetical protein